MIALINSPASDILPSGNPMWFSVVSYTPITAFLRLNVGIYATNYDYATPLLITTLQFAYNSVNPVLDFDVHSIINSLLKLDKIYLNSLGETLPVKFYLSFYETNIPDNTPLATAITSNTYYAIKAVLNRANASELSVYSLKTRFRDKFLTEMPKQRNVYGDNPIAISFPNFTQAGYYNIEIHFSIKYDDDSFFYTQYLIAPTYGKFVDIIYTPSGLNSTVKKPRLMVVSVYLPGSSLPLDAVIYNFIYTPVNRQRHFIFRNNLGGLDFFTCTGLLEQKLSGGSDLYARTIPKNNYNSQESDLGIVPSDAYNSYRINTGLKSKKEIENMLYFFSSPQRLLYNQDPTETAYFKFIPVNSKLNAGWRKDKDQLHALTFDFELAFNSKTHFPII